MLYFCIALKGHVRNNPETGKFGNLGNFLKIHRKKDQILSQHMMHTGLSITHVQHSEPLVISTLPYVADIVTPEEQEQVFAASVHNLSKLAAVLLKECTRN